jgi:glycosyltransferase involved in cell wall biosynthesis
MNSDRPRIIIFSLGYFPKLIGGAEVAVKELTQHLPAYDWHMCTVRGDMDAEEHVGRVHVMRVGMRARNIHSWWGRCTKILYIPLAAWKAVQAHRKHPFTIGWCVMASYAGLAGLLFHLMTGVPYVLTLQEGDTPQYIHRRAVFLWPFYRLVFRRAARVQVISHFLADYARSMGAKGPIEVIPNGVDQRWLELGAQPLSEERRAAIYAKWGIASNAKVLITSSRLVHKNAVDVCIKALEFLPSDWFLVVAGTGPEKTMLQEIVEKFDKTLNIQKRVVWLGHVSHADLPAYIQAATIFVRPSRSEGLGNAFLEAMAVRTPIIGTPVGGIPDFLHEGKTGRSIPVDDARALAATAQDIVNNPHASHAMIDRAYELIKSGYSWSDIAIRFREVLDAVKSEERKSE